MFKNIHVLIVMYPQHKQLAEMLEQCAESMKFGVKVSTRPKDCLDLAGNKKDILILGYQLYRDSRVLLERWVEAVGGPVWIISTENTTISDEDEDSLILKGAWNVSRNAPSAAVSHMTLYRFGGIVLEGKLRNEVRLQRRAIIALALMVAGLLGERILELLPAIAKLVGG